jgi:hypothetical protein
MVELYLHSPVYLHGIVLNNWAQGQLYLTYSISIPQSMGIVKHNGDVMNQPVLLTSEIQKSGLHVGAFFVIKIELWRHSNSNKHFEPDHPVTDIKSLHARSSPHDSDARHAICCHPEVPLDRRTACFAVRRQFYVLVANFTTPFQQAGFIKSRDVRHPIWKD